MTALKIECRRTHKPQKMDDNARQLRLTNDTQTKHFKSASLLYRYTKTVDRMRKLSYVAVHTHTKLKNSTCNKPGSWERSLPESFIASISLCLATGNRHENDLYIASTYIYMHVHVDDLHVYTSTYSQQKRNQLSVTKYSNHKRIAADG